MSMLLECEANRNTLVKLIRSLILIILAMIRKKSLIQIEKNLMIIIIQ